VQTLVNAPGKNANTVFLPEKSSRVRFFLSWSGSEKSGAFLPSSTNNIEQSFFG